MVVKFMPILPPMRAYSDAKLKAEMARILEDVIHEFQTEMQKYPAWKPWKNPPKTGLRAGGKRTGNYGRGWGASAKITRRGFEEVLIENLVEYATYVGGSRQTSHMVARGWPNSRKVAEAVVRRMGQQGKLRLKIT